MMGELLTTMVANDAFTQALTNPLLARNVFNEAHLLRRRDEDHQGHRVPAADPGEEHTVLRAGRRQLQLLSAASWARPSAPAANVLACPLDFSPRTPPRSRMRSLARSTPART